MRAGPDACCATAAGPHLEPWLHAYGAMAQRGRSGSSAAATVRLSSADPGGGQVDLTAFGSSNASATVSSGDRAQTVRAGSSGPRGFNAVNSTLDELADGPETGRFSMVSGPEPVSELEPESGYEPTVDDPSGLIPASPLGATAPEPAGDAGGGTALSGPRIRLFCRIDCCWKLLLRSSAAALLYVYQPLGLAQATMPINNDGGVFIRRVTLESSAINWVAVWS